MKPTRRSIFLILTLVVLVGVQLACSASENATAPAQPAAFATQAAVSTAGPTAGAVIEMPPAIPEMRLLTLEFPPKIRAGDSDRVILTLEVDENGGVTPTVSSAGNVTRGETVVIPNLFDTHNVLAEARLDLAGVDVRQGETISETLLPRQKVTFFWSVLPAEVGNYKGTVWFYLHFIPKTSAGVESRQALSAQPIEIEATSFLGLSVTPARWLGFLGSAIGSLLGLPFLESILKLLWKRLRGG